MDVAKYVYLILHPLAEPRCPHPRDMLACGFLLPRDVVMYACPLMYLVGMLCILLLSGLAVHPRYLIAYIWMILTPVAHSSGRPCVPALMPEDLCILSILFPVPGMVYCTGLTRRMRSCCWFLTAWHGLCNLVGGKRSSALTAGPNGGQASPGHAPPLRGSGYGPIGGIL